MEGDFDTARFDDIPDLKELWRQCFYTEEAYHNFYFERRFVPEDTLIWRQDGKVVSMVTLMDVRLNGEKGSYLYAVATLPSFQRQGLYRKLDRRAEEETLKRGGSFCCLVPAKPSLFSLYEKMGYHLAFGLNELLLQGEGKAFYEFSPCPFERFFELRNGYLKGLTNPVVHPKRELKYIYEELCRFFGGVFCYEEEGKTCYAAFSCSDGEIYLQECSGRFPQRAAYSLMALYGKEKAKIHSPLFGGTGKPVPFGMGKSLKNGGLPLTERPLLQEGAPLQAEALLEGKSLAEERSLLKGRSSLEAKPLSKGRPLSNEPPPLQERSNGAGYMALMLD